MWVIKFIKFIISFNCYFRCLKACGKTFSTTSATCPIELVATASPSNFIQASLFYFILLILLPVVKFSFYKIV